MGSLIIRHELFTPYVVGISTSDGFIVPTNDYMLSIHLINSRLLCCSDFHCCIWTVFYQLFQHTFILCMPIVWTWCSNLCRIIWEMESMYILFTFLKLLFVVGYWLSTAISVVILWLFLLLSVSHWMSECAQRRMEVTIWSWLLLRYMDKKLMR